MPNFPDFLLEGYQQFRSGKFQDEQQRYLDLAREGQKPEVMIIACCDSRSAPETIFNVRPGDMFVARNVANLVPPYEPAGGLYNTAAALEFAVNGLHVKHIVVVGHAKCGGIMAALSTDRELLSDADFVGKWTDLIGPAADALEIDPEINASEKQTALEQKSVQSSIENLRTYPFISKLEGAGKLELHGAWFDISLGELWTMDPASGDFQKV